MSLRHGCESRAGCLCQLAAAAWSTSAALLLPPLMGGPWASWPPRCHHTAIEGEESCFSGRCPRNSGRDIPLLTSLSPLQIEMAQKLLNSDLGELINKMKLAQQCVMTSLQQEYKKQMLTAAHALAVDAKNLLDVIDQARLRMLGPTRPH